MNEKYDGKLDDAFERFIEGLDWVMTEQRERFATFLSGLPNEDLERLTTLSADISNAASLALSRNIVMAEVAKNAEVEEGTESADDLEIGEWVEVAGSPVGFLKDLAGEFTSALSAVKDFRGFDDLSNKKIREVLLSAFNSLYGCGIDGRSVDAKSFFISLGEMKTSTGPFDMAALPFELSIHLDPKNAEADGQPGYYALPFVLKASVTTVDQNGAIVGGEEIPPNSSYFKISLKAAQGLGGFSRIGMRFDGAPKVDKGSLTRRLISSGRY